MIFLILLSGINVMSKATASTSSGITLVDAFQIGLTESRKWDAQANLISITSVGDTSSTPPSTLAIDGKREVWNLLFGNGQRNQILIINIKKGKIAIKNDVKPGEGWAKGYHFNVIKDHQALFFGVIGQNKYGMMTKLYMDKTGKVLGSETKNEGLK
ncbi:hypothetical protein [Paenibacillus sp. FSL H7-0737]|nr:hypothetical protein [Paenibacillus sp. FSL H7-0737]